MLNTAFHNDIRQTLDHFRRSVDQLFDSYQGYPTERQSSGGAGREAAANWTFSPVLETGWTDQTLHLRAIVPGVKQGDVNVNLQGNQLVISGERKMPEGFGRNGFTQLAYGKFQTAVTLPSGLDVDKVRCELHEGVLDVSIPIAETMKPRQIPIDGANQQKTLNA
jgi:HSP20 family protein